MNLAKREYVPFQKGEHSIREDGIFKIVFGSNQRSQYLKEFLESILHRKITNIVVMNDVALNKTHEDNKLMRLDILAEVDGKEKINVEIQNKNEYNVIERSEVYASGIVYNALNVGDKYSKVPETIVIWLLGFNIFKDGNYHEISRMRRDYNGEPIDDNITYHYIQLPKFLEQTKEIKTKEEQWLAYITNSLNKEELEEIKSVYDKTPKDVTLTVGFNRRFSPYATKLKQLVGEGPKNIVATMNAGFIPADMWVHDLEIGGGRIVGEACHFIDLCSYIAGSKVIAVCMNAMGVNPEENTDNATILLKYENGSNAVINYFANGSKSYAKERVEVYSQERVFVVDNWRKLQAFGVKGFSKKSGTMDKGHRDEFALLNERILKGGEPLIDFDCIVNTTEASFAAIESLRSGKWVKIS